MIVGASIAGCSAATLLARAGAKVALVESKSDPAAHKPLCTHFIQASATPTIQRLGLADALEQAGAERNHFRMWTRFGWVIPPRRDFKTAPYYGYSLRRSVLDPLLREHAAATPGVDLLLGHTARELLRNESRVAGVTVEADGEQIELAAPLTIAADGRNSRVAEMAGSKAKLKANERFGYFAHFRGVKFDADEDVSRIWLLDPTAAYSFPNDSGITLLAAMPPKSELAEFKQDLAGNLLKTFAKLPGKPDLSRVERVTEVRGVTDLPSRRRRPQQPGLAFIGDAARASDPLWGIGCGWAFQSAEWLSDAVGDAVAARDPKAIDRALKSYARTHRRKLAAHDFLINDYATGRPLNPVERLMFSAAVHDGDLAHHVHAFGTRTISPRQFLAPRTLLRALRVRRRAASAA